MKLENKKLCFRVLLEQHLKSYFKDPDFQVINLAMDETSTFNFFDRSPLSSPWMRYSQEKEKIFSADEKLDHSYFIDENNHYKPLKIL